MYPKVSVIVPVYNVEKYIGICIDSLLGQTLKDLEIILVNDASPDQSIDILRSYEKQYPDRIVVIDSRENKRQGGARNLGICKAQGEFIGFVDGDDFVRSDMYEVLLNKMQETCADFVCIKAARVGEGADNTSTDLKDISPYIVWNDELWEANNKELTDTDREKLMVYGTGGVWSKLYKRDWILQNNLFFPENTAYEDNYWDTMMCLYVKKYFLIDQVMYYYRTNPESTMNKKGLYHLDRISIEEKLSSDMTEKGEGVRYHNGLEYICAVRYFSSTFYLLAGKVDSMPWEYVKRQKKFLKTNYPDFKNNIYLKKLPVKARLRVIFSYDFPHICYFKVKSYMMALQLYHLLRRR